MANDITQKKPEKPSPEEQQKPQAGSHPGRRVTDQPVETTPSEERGERLATGKTIARGGKTTGHVPGAMPSAGHDPKSS